MLTAISGLVLFMTGAAGGSGWIIPLGALFMLDRSWHAQHAYRQQFSVALADEILPYATMMSALQAGAMAAAAFGLGRLVGLVVAG
jgi:hypothetical protein